MRERLALPEKSIATIEILDCTSLPLGGYTM